MYIPKNFRNENLDSVKDFIHHNGFAILISQVNGKPWATHIPLLLDKNTEDKDVLVGHISKANTQWKEFDSNEELLAIFSGPHAYVSSSWYDHENVPTWNYIAVHVYGKIRIIEGAELKQQLSKLVDKYEAKMKEPISIEKMSEGFIDREMKGIVGFEIEITSIQAASKLSQNRNEKDHANIVNSLEQQGDTDSIAVAELMKKNRL